MQTDQALNVLEALIVLTGDPKLSLAQCCGILRNVKSAIELSPTSDATSLAKSQLKSQRTSDAEHKPVKSRFVSVGRKKLGRPRKVAQK